MINLSHNLTASQVAIIVAMGERGQLNIDADELIIRVNATGAGFSVVECDTSASGEDHPWQLCLDGAHVCYSRYQHAAWREADSLMRDAVAKRNEAMV